jgi:hypothetical protein
LTAPTKVEAEEGAGRDNKFVMIGRNSSILKSDLLLWMSNCNTGCDEKIKSMYNWSFAGIGCFALYSFN